MSFVRSNRATSWHHVATPTRMFDTYLTRCGRTVVSKETRDSEPLDEKGCESCARLVNKDVETDRYRAVKAAEDRLTL